MLTQVAYLKRKAPAGAEAFVVLAIEPPAYAGGSDS